MKRFTLVLLLGSDLRRTAKIIAVWCLLFFVIGEAGLRLIAWVDGRWNLSGKAESALTRTFLSPSVVEDMRRLSPSLVYRNTPNYKSPYAQINSHGFRGAEFKLSKSTESFRIVCLGDSCTFGWFVDDQNTYPAILEKELDSVDPATEVINAGVPGYSAWQVAAWCREEIFALKPDALILYVGWNDLFEAKPEMDTQMGRGEKMRAYILRQSFLVTRLRYVFGRLFKRGESNGDKNLYLHYRPNFFVSQMESLLQEASRGGLSVFLMTLPTSYVDEGQGAQSQTPYFPETPGKFGTLYNAYNSAIRDLSAKNGTGLIDLTQLMNGRKELFSDFCHPSASGNRVIAQTISEKLRPLIRDTFSIRRTSKR